jgi:hypothetical protein
MALQIQKPQGISVSHYSYRSNSLGPSGLATHANLRGIGLQNTHLFYDETNLQAIVEAVGNRKCRFFFVGAKSC